MKNTKKYKDRAFSDVIINSPLAMLVISVAAICLGIFFIFSQSDNKPIERGEAVSYSGEFENYESLKNYRTIYFEDGSQYSVYPQSETSEFRKTMMSLDKGTKLYILVNPNNDYVVEVRTDTEELLNFESSQEVIDAHDNDNIVIGYIACAAGVFLIIYAIVSANYKHKENVRHAEKRAKFKDKGANSSMLRHADFAEKNKILSEASAEGYTICYRRVRSVNELVINGKVYDEKKGVIEFEHKLCAILDGHSIEAGTDENGYSYIMFDGEIIEYKRRLI